MGVIRRLLLPLAQKTPHRGGDLEGSLGGSHFRNGHHGTSASPPVPSEWVQGRPAAADKAVAGHGQQTTGAFAIRGAHV